MRLPDYCNNPVLALPVMVDNRIGVIPPSEENGKWKAAHRGVCNDNPPHYVAMDDNPLRAAMIVYLILKDVEKWRD